MPGPRLIGVAGNRAEVCGPNSRWDSAKAKVAPAAWAELRLRWLVPNDLGRAEVKVGPPIFLEPEDVAIAPVTAVAMKAAGISKVVVLSSALWLLGNRTSVRAGLGGRRREQTGDWKRSRA